MGFKVVVVEDDKLILELISGFLVASEKFEEVKTYNDGRLFLEQIDFIQEETSVVILDYRLGNISAEVILKDLQHKPYRVPVIVLTSHYNQYLIGHMIRAGASGYLPKNIKPEELLVVIEEVMQKGHYISPDQFPYLRLSYDEENNYVNKARVDLTERDLEVIFLLANQYTAKEIADKLCVSPKTVEGYKNALFTKTKTKGVVGLVIFAVQNGLINAEEINLAFDH